MSDTSSFRADIDRFVAKLTENQRKVFVNSASAVQKSITDGAPETGAPGQPVDTGYLKQSWQLEFETPTTALIATNVAYAPVHEEGNRAAYDDRGVGRPPEWDAKAKAQGRESIRSTVGGNHSVKLTRQAFDRVVEKVVRELGI